MGLIRKKIGKQGSWPKAIFLFLSPIILILAIRWLLFEPFVIPSGSMIPNLLIHDHLFVKKFSYGVRFPIGDGWLYKWSQPQRGDIVVFRYPLNRDVFFIKRVIGLPGDKLNIQNGQITVNDKPWVIYPLTKGVYPEEDEFNYFIETIPATDVAVEKEHTIRLFSATEHIDSEEKNIIVPNDTYFMMGDNRDQSDDSRFWGFVEEKYLVGKASLIWLSCSDMIPTAPMICDPLKIRAERIFKKVNEQ